jgi:putative acetyltransferase
MPDDLAVIESLYPEAFPDEDLLPLLGELLRESSTTLSLVGKIDGLLVGHVIFTKCHVAESAGADALLGPLAIAPAWQRRGIGSTIVRAGLQRLEDAGVAQVYVLGDPAYYGRLGFKTEMRVTPPYELPPEWVGAWQSQTLTGAAKPRSGKLLLPRPWLQPALWTP